MTLPADTTCQIRRPYRWVMRLPNGTILCRSPADYADLERAKDQARRLVGNNQQFEIIVYKGIRPMFTTGTTDASAVDRFTISTGKLEAVMRELRGMRVSADKRVLAQTFMLKTDWPEHEEHQRWLDEASPREIAEWCRAGAF